jgi:hypothetical protein
MLRRSGGGADGKRRSKTEGCVRGVLNDKRKIVPSTVSVEGVRTERASEEGKKERSKKGRKEGREQRREQGRKEGKKEGGSRRKGPFVENDYRERG